ncbi:hypothetical protein C8P68_1157 [Mucilaginibacter yixingensis]|uniref:Uncharacterized protein n=1 Tax=Mucilaginibacter yixingensis TaxID=1295612 RepID=A0A2T5J4C4_9SPHI|nr:hypothetical protein [Mucilaginibacter yixingensis]PTQ92011.1 hypothetical protein C8P68_1157 [Mucilaginibacter yixingensis]
MVISAIIKEQVIYITAHAEQSYTGTYLADKGDVEVNIDAGIYGQELTKETLTNICAYIEATVHGRDHDLVIDFEGVRDVQINQRPLIVKLKSLVRHLVLTNIGLPIVKRLEVDIYVNNALMDDAYPVFHVSDQAPALELVPLDELFYKKFVQLLQAHTIDNGTQEAFHHHSPIYLPKFVDIKGMAVADQPFFLYVIYRLALQMLAKAEWSSGDEKPILFCQNMNGALIATVLSGFLKWDLLSMDHIGPVNKVYSNIGSKIKSDARYIVVADMVCLGTEVRICQNIINYSGGQYIGHVSIVKVDTLRPGDQAKDALSVFHISRENNPIDYQILTALNNLL